MLEKRRQKPAKIPASASSIQRKSNATLTQDTTYALNTAARKKAGQRPGRSSKSARARPAVIEPATTALLMDSVVVNVCQSSPERTSAR